MTNVYREARVRVACATVLFLCLLATACAKRPPENVEQVSANANEQPHIASVDVVKAFPQPLNLARGESGEAIVRIKIDSGYHINANPPSYPYLKATELALSPESGIAVAFITYPTPLTKKFSFAENPLAVYEGETELKVRLSADRSAKTGVHNLSVKLRVQACDEQVCYAPGALDLTLPVSIK